MHKKWVFPPKFARKKNGDEVVTLIYDERDVISSNPCYFDDKMVKKWAGDDG